jgi:hypothetical protein
MGLVHQGRISKVVAKVGVRVRGKMSLVPTLLLARMLSFRVEGHGDGYMWRGW